MKITEPGVYLDFDTASYFADPCMEPSLTQSIAKVLIKQSAAHARLEHPRLSPQTDDDDDEPEKYDATKAIGNAAHAVMIGRSRDIAEGEFPNWRGKIPQEFKKDAMADGKLVILSKHLARARALVKEASFQLDLAGHKKAFRDGHGEVVLAWREGDIWFRSLVDWMVDTTLLYDLKTSGISCAPHDLGRVAESAGWHVQAAFHERGLDILDPSNAGRRKFHFIAVENTPPYALVPVLLDEYWMTMGRKKVEYAVQLWTHCITKNIWPSYPLDTFTPQYPGFAETKWLEREIHHEATKRQPQFDAENMRAG